MGPGEEEWSGSKTLRKTECLKHQIGANAFPTRVCCLSTLKPFFPSTIRMCSTKISTTYAQRGAVWGYTSILQTRFPIERFEILVSIVMNYETEKKYTGTARSTRGVQVSHTPIYISKYHTKLAKYEV